MAQKRKKGDWRDNPLWFLFSKTWRYSEGNRDKIVWYWMMFLAAESISLLSTPLVMAKIINVIQKEGITSGNLTYLLELLFLTLAIRLIFWSLHGPARLVERDNAFKARANYRKYLQKGVMTLPMEWHVEHHSGDTIDKIEKGTAALYGFSESTCEVIYAAVQLVISYAMLVYFSRSAAYLVLMMVFVMVWIIMRFDRVLIGQYEELNHAENRISESVHDAINNIVTVIILRVEKLVFQAIVHKIEQPYDLFRRNNRLNEMKWFLTGTCCNVMTILVLGGYFVHNVGAPQGILIGNVYLLIQYVYKIGDLFFQFTNMYGDILIRKARVMNAEELAQDFREESFANHVLPPDWRQLKIEGLNFSYDGQGQDLHLEDIAMSFKRGERIALVGGSGSGKTTFLSVLRDLYHPRDIKLSVDNREVVEGFAGISRAIALVPQDPEIFATTILENITLGTEYDLEFVRRFTDMACFSEVVDGLPHGFASAIKEKGVNLSGGQQQRLALARGLLACHDKDIVLLDEPTSSVDAANEIEIYSNIFRAFGEKTVISTVHRLHLLPLFHRVYFFYDGQIVASGRFNDLLKSCSMFRELWQKYHEQQDQEAAL